MNKKPSENRTTHLVFLRDRPLQEIVAGRKRFEMRLSFRGLACASVREGDVLLLKRVGGEVEAALAKPTPERIRSRHGARFAQREL